VLGDRQCRFDLSTPGYATERAVEALADRRLFRFAAFSGFADRWFEKGRLVVLSGAAAGLIGQIKSDQILDGGRVIELWDQIGPEIATGAAIRLEPGCDKLAATCREKFDNFLNFRGFPHIPGEDWLISYPVSSGVNDGGSLA
jgi:uncharacterized phage protein (TIGR02218 family)